MLGLQKNGDNNPGGQPTPNEAQSPARNLGQRYYGDGGIFGTNLKKSDRKKSAIADRENAENARKTIM